jgi:hypothetical protein
MVLSGTPTLAAKSRIDCTANILNASCNYIFMPKRFDTGLEAFLCIALFTVLSFDLDEHNPAKQYHYQVRRASPQSHADQLHLLYG